MANKRTKKPEWSAKIIQAAQFAAAASEKDMTPRDRHLGELVDRVVARGSDRPVREAIDQLTVRHEYDAADLVEMWAEEAATSMPVQLAPPGEDAALATLFLIPLVIADEGTHSIPMTVQTTTALDHIAQSLRAHGLVGAEPTVIVLPYLYRLVDLPTSWAGRRRWLQALAMGASGQPATMPTPTSETQPATSGEAAVLHLRFMIGATVVGENDTDLGPLPSGELEDFDDAGEDEISDSADLSRRLEEWRKNVEAIFAKVIKGASVMVAWPNAWEIAVLQGIASFNFAATTIQLAVLDHLGVAPATVTATITALQNDNGRYWVVDLNADSGESNQVQWLCGSDPREELEDLTDFLRDQGIERWQIDERT